MSYTLGKFAILLTVLTIFASPAEVFAQGGGSPGIQIIPNVPFVPPIQVIPGVQVGPAAAPGYPSAPPRVHAAASIKS